MGAISGNLVIAGQYGVFLNAGAPGDGTNEVQTLTIGGTPTGGTFKLTYDGHTTDPISWSSTNATLVSNVQAALDALPNIESGDVTVADSTLASGIGDMTITFGGNQAKLNVASISVASNDLEGSSPTVSVAVTTDGVTATQRLAAKGALLIDTSNGVLYINAGTPADPTWTVVGTQT